MGRLLRSIGLQNDFQEFRAHSRREDPAWNPKAWGMHAFVTTSHLGLQVGRSSFEGGYKLFRLLVVDCCGMSQQKSSTNVCKALRHQGPEVLKYQELMAFYMTDSKQVAVLQKRSTRRTFERMGFQRFIRDAEL